MLKLYPLKQKKRSYFCKNRNFNNKKNTMTLNEAQKKLEHFCAYQERCHDEVLKKLQSLRMTSGECDLIIVKLIADNYLNESRFACSFARGKHRIKYWGKNRIVNELKARYITAPNIKLALQEIEEDEYLDTLEMLATKHWQSINEKNLIKKRKKFCDFLLRKGYESHLVYEKLKYLESTDGKK
jgi:regulatory protein